MAIPVYAAGDAVYIYGTGPARAASKPHVHVIVKIDADKGNIYVVPMSSYRPNCDEACVLQPNDGWGAVQHKSFIEYDKAKIMVIKGSEMGLEELRITFLGKVPEPIYAKVIKGINESDEVEPWFSRAF